MKPLQPIMNVRYEITKQEVAQGYLHVRDRLQEKVLMGRSLPRLPRIRASLERWSCYAHPCFVPVFRYLEQERAYLAILKPLESGERSLAEINKNTLRVEEVANIFTHLAHAYTFLSRQRLAHPHLDLSKIYHGGKYPVRILGHEASIPMDSTRSEDALPNLDIRYTAPEVLTAKTRTTAGEIYHLAALFHHFLTGETYDPGLAYPGITPTNRKYKMVWDEMLGAMLAKDPNARPGWEDVLAWSQKLLDDAPRISPTVWLGRDDTHTVGAMEKIMAGVKSKPHAVALQVYPGRERFQRLAPFTRWAESRRFLVFHTWLSQRQTRHYTAINQIVWLLREGVATALEHTGLASELTPLSEWYSADELFSKWRELLERVFKLMVPDHAEGVVLIIEDVQHMDRASLETLINLSSWLGGFPFMLIITGHSFVHENLVTLRERWPHDWTYLHQKPMDSTSWARLSWEAEGSLREREQVMEDILVETNGIETMVFYRLLERKKGEPLENYLGEMWSCMPHACRRVLKVLVCSARPFSSQDLELSLGLKDTGNVLQRLMAYQFVSEVTTGRFAVAVPVLARYCRERLPEHERQQIMEKLYDYERKLEKPDEVQRVFLYIMMTHQRREPIGLAGIKETVLERFEVKTLLRLAGIYACYRLRHLVFFYQLAQIVQSMPLNANEIRDSPEISGLSHAARRERKAEWGRAFELYRQVSVRRRAPLGLRGYAFMRMGECAAANGDGLAFMKAFRQFDRLDPDQFPEDIYAEWLARMIASSANAKKEIPGMHVRSGALPEHWRDWLGATDAMEKGEFSEAVTLAHRAVGVLQDHHDLDWRGGLFKLYGNALYRNNRPDEAIRAYLKAETCFTKTGNQRALKSVSFNLASAEKLAGRFIACEQRFMPMLERAESENDQDSLCRILYNLMACALLRNNHQGFDHYWSQHMGLAKTLGLGAERVRGLALRLHNALTLSDAETNELAKEMKQLANSLDLDPLLRDEVCFAERWALFAQGLRAKIPETYPRFTRWRHRLTDALCGDDQLTISDLLEQIGEGYFGALHFHLLKEAVENFMIPREHFTPFLATKFENHARHNGILYGSFLRRHFAHLHNMGDAPREAWEQALRTFESITWRQTNPNRLEEELLQGLRSIWPFDQWGICRRYEGRWCGLSGTEDEVVYKHLDHLVNREIREPLVSNLTSPGYEATRGMLILPTTTSRHPEPTLAWFVHDRAAVHDLGFHYEPIFRFYGKLFDYLIYRGETSSPTLNTRELRSDESRFGIVGRSGRVLGMIKSIHKFGPSDLNIFIWGESGTGKELAAKALHKASGRKGQPFRALDCSHFPENLVESELFGFVKGAFTGAEHNKAGLLEMVDGGTLFLDEIGDISAKTQALLLRVIQEGEFSRVGESEVRKVDIRFVTATNKNLRELVDQGTFRGDLFFRLVEHEIDVPALRYRMEDLPLLANHFLRKHAPDRKAVFSSSFFDRTRSYRWPGNIREFESYIRKILVEWPDHEQFTAAETLPFMRENADGLDEESLAKLEESNRVRILRERLARFGGNRTTTAESLSISRQQLSALITRYKIEQPRDEGG